MFITKYPYVYVFVADFWDVIIAVFFLAWALWTIRAYRKEKARLEEDRAKYGVIIEKSRELLVALTRDQQMLRTLADWQLRRDNEERERREEA